MQIAMDHHEIVLFTSFLNRSERYLEFGSGGSTWLASQTKKDWIISVDSSNDWLKKVAEATHESATKPELLHIDIGELRDWGFPANRSKQDSWPHYHNAVWERQQSRQADLYFVDGRFRVACFVQCLLHAETEAFVAIHDFANRPQYHVVKELAREVAMANKMSVFQIPFRLNRFEAEQVLSKHWMDPE